jgi:hypothetical protein
VVSSFCYYFDIPADMIGARTFDFPELSEVGKHYPQYYHMMEPDKVRPFSLSHCAYYQRNCRLNIYARTTQRLVFGYDRGLSVPLRLPAAAGHPVETSVTMLDPHNVSLPNFVRVRDYRVLANVRARTGVH